MAIGQAYWSLNQAASFLKSPLFRGGIPSEARVASAIGEMRVAVSHLEGTNYSKMASRVQEALDALNAAPQSSTSIATARREAIAGREQLGIEPSVQRWLDDLLD